MKKTTSFFNFIWRNIDASLCIILAFVAGVMGIWGMEVNYVISAIACVLTLLSYGVLKDREIRDKLNAKILSFEIPQNTDSIFLEKTDEGVLLKKAEHEIILLQESGSKILTDYRTEIINLLRKGGKVKCVVVLGQEENIVKLMSFRNFDLYEYDLMKRQLGNGVELLKIIQRNSKEYASKLEVRFFPYPIDITGVFIDTNNELCKAAIIRLQGFKLRFEEKPTLRISGQNSANSFQLYHNQMLNIWKYSTKCIFLTGNPGVGKSTLLCKIVEKLKKMKSQNLRMDGFLTKEIIKSGKRVGFTTETLDKTQSGQISKKDKNNYLLNNELMDNLIIPTIMKGIENGNTNLLIIDEIGPIQSQSELFKESIKKAIDTHRISILGIIANNENDEFSEEIKCNFRTNIITVNHENRDKLIDEIINEFI